MVHKEHDIPYVNLSFDFHDLCRLRRITYTPFTYVSVYNKLLVVLQSLRIKTSFWSLLVCIVLIVVSNLIWLGNFPSYLYFYMVFILIIEYILLSVSQSVVLVGFFEQLFIYITTFFLIPWLLCFFKVFNKDFWWNPSWTVRLLGFFNLAENFKRLVSRFFFNNSLCTDFFQGSQTLESIIWYFFLFL